MNTGLLSGAVLVLLTGNAMAISITSVSSGDWNSPSTWSPPVVPGPADSVTISAGDTVFLASAGTPAAPTVDVDALTIDGTLVSDNVPGFGNDMHVSLNTLVISASGLIQTQDGTGTSPGSSLFIVGKQALNITVDGVMTLGNGWAKNIFTNAPGDGGGSLNIWGNQIPSSTFACSGMIFAGSEGGDISITGMSNILINGGLLAAGDSKLAGTPGKIQLTSDLTLDIGAGATIQSGDSPFVLSFGAYGSIVASTNGTLNVAASAVVDGMSWGCVFLWGNSSTILGTVNSPCLSWEPPNLRLTGAGTLSGDSITIGAQNFKADSLAGPGAINGANTIEVFVNPGGVFDLRGLASGTNWLTAGQSITIRADAGNILTDSGVSIGSLMSPAPTVLPAEALRDLIITGTSTTGFSVDPGQVLTLHSSVLNFGAVSEPVQVTFSDDQGWLQNPGGNSTTLAPGGSLDIPLSLAIPSSVAPAEKATITITANAPTSPPMYRQAEIVVRVRQSCPADFDLSWYVDFDDYNAFVAAYESDDNTSADFDASGFTDTDDFEKFVAAFERGC